MRKILAAVIPLAILAIGFALLTHSAQASVISPARHACAAFQTWNHSRTTAHLNAMLKASKHASATIRTDIVVVYTEVRQGDWYDLPDDTHFTAQDCAHIR